MHLPYLFPSLAALLSVATAVPYGHSTMHSPTLTPSRSDKPSVSPSSTRNILPTASPVGAYSCPQQQHKQCCMSLQETSEGLMRKLGDVVPILGGVQISSLLSFQCKDMKEDEDPNTCQGNGYAPMCCNSGSGGAVNTCKPFAAAKEEYYRTLGYGEEDQVDVVNDAVP